MARKRKNGQGTVRLRSDGRWEGRHIVGYDENGKAKQKSVLAKTSQQRHGGILARYPRQHPDQHDNTGQRNYPRQQRCH